MKTLFDDKTYSYHLDYSDEIIPQFNVTDQVMKAIVADREKKITNALIELGWTPPSKNPPTDL